VISPVAAASLCRHPALCRHWQGVSEVARGRALRARAEATRRAEAALPRLGQVGAPPWEERAESELRATGETARRRDPSTLDQLTPQELQIAGFVAAGMTNRQVAAQLYLSPRTIDYHLRKVFSKLGVASRTELVQMGVPEQEPV
jgi:DNA-binding NarL/FixJ family response regulator